MRKSIYVFGLRGFPHVQGGVERHCQKLYPRLVKAGFRITAFTRRAFTAHQGHRWRGVRLVPLAGPRRQGLEAFVHSALATMVCLIRRPDGVHIHNIGPGLFCPLLRWRGIRVIVTVHRFNYRDEKWSLLGRAVLRLGEWVCLRFAHEVIVVSDNMRAFLEDKYRREDVNVIPNGVDEPVRGGRLDILGRFGLEGCRYILLVSRITPEKGADLLIEAFGRLGPGDVKLVIAGRNDHTTRYAARIRRLASTRPNVILTGFLDEHELNGLYANASLFVLPSYHEGLPIALLEALSHGLSVLCSDIPANREIGLSEDRYFPCGDAESLARRLRECLCQEPLSMEQRRRRAAEIRSRFNWDRVAAMTMDVYERAFRSASPFPGNEPIRECIRACEGPPDRCDAGRSVRP